tara:strand:- start:383 stop:964 length:582 start_codon:yes stop_codon:yes gene_type:complete
MRETTQMNELKIKFQEAGFVDSDMLMSGEGIALPDGAFVMHNSYGLMAAMEILETGDELLRVLNQCQEDMQDYIRKSLMFLENRKGLIVDGYLILVLQKEPEIKIKDLVREMELNTKVCRKHVVWPMEGLAGLDRLQFITVLSLPKPLPSNAINNSGYDLSVKAKILIDEYRSLKSLDRVLDSIKSGVMSDAD